VLSKYVVKKNDVGWSHFILQGGHRNEILIFDYLLGNHNIDMEFLHFSTAV